MGLFYFGEEMNPQTTAAVASSGESSIEELFALSDEQILDIAPEKQVARPDAVASEEAPPRQTLATRAEDAMPSATAPSSTGHESRATSHDAAEPPAWLTAQMQDPWGGEEAREFWDGVRRARSEAAAYRAAIASPEDARALKELYPGGVSEARAVAERARLLDEVDRAYFGAAGNSPEQLSASRAQLAQRMLHEDPAAFREMVEAGIRVLQEAGTQNHATKSIASAISEPRANRHDAGENSLVAAQHAASPQGNAAPAATPASQALHGSPVTSYESLSAYAAFERAANDDLERSVGGAIERTLAQALPSFEQHNTPGQAGANHSFASPQDRAAPLRERLAASVRAEVEKALQGDRQLGEQVTQILASRRFDNDARAQIVRLIGERAQQLVPGAAKRVLNEWTQTTLAAHRGSTQRTDSASSRADVALARPEVYGRASVPAHPAGSEKAHARQQNAPRSSGQGGAAKSQPINYRKLSDEQILEM
jgi:hypothetical protein